MCNLFCPFLFHKHHSTDLHLLLLPINFHVIGLNRNENYLHIHDAALVPSIESVHGVHLAFYFSLSLAAAI